MSAVLTTVSRPHQVPPAFMPLMNAAMFAAMRPPMMPMGVSPPSGPLPPQMPAQPFGQVRCMQQCWRSTHSAPGRIRAVPVFVTL
jgi:hypothetical protein